ncbi:MAG TPA: hypothetical protein VF533_09315 [Solirubrobacteraceae bacterium]
MRAMSLIVSVVVLAVGVAATAAARPVTEPTQACVKDGGPLDVRLRPSRGPVGTRIHVSGRCFGQALDRRNGYPGPFLSRYFAADGCEAIAGGRSTVRANRHGMAHGWFEVPARGLCFQQRDGRHRITPGRYEVGSGCHACVVASFRVTRR